MHSVELCPWSVAEPSVDVLLTMSPSYPYLCKGVPWNVKDHLLLFHVYGTERGWTIWIAKVKARRCYQLMRHGQDWRRTSIRSGYVQSHRTTDFGIPRFRPLKKIIFVS